MPGGPWSPMHSNKWRTALISKDCINAVALRDMDFPNSCYSVSKPANGRSVWPWLSAGKWYTDRQVFLRSGEKAVSPHYCQDKEGWTLMVWSGSLIHPSWWSSLSFPHPYSDPRTHAIVVAPLPKALLWPPPSLQSQSTRALLVWPSPEPIPNYAWRAVLIALSWEPIPWPELFIWRERRRGHNRFGDSPLIICPDVLLAPKLLLHPVSADFRLRVSEKGPC